MTELIYNYLTAKCIGYENRVKAKTIMQMFDINDHKTFRSYIQMIREDRTYPQIIGSQAGKDGGYWIIANKKEFDDTVFHLYARAKEMEKMCKILKKKSRKLERGF